MDLDTSMDAEISLDLDAQVKQDVDLGHLAETITTHVKVLQDYHKTDATSLTSFDSVAYTPTLSSSIPPSVQFISALKWLIHFKIFNLVPDESSISVPDLAFEADVPASELVRKWLAKDENFLQGLPFFVDVVMPASAKAAAATINWPGTREATETARNLAFKNKLDFHRHLINHGVDIDFVQFMNLVTEGRHPSATLLAGVVRDTINWSLLERDALVIDLGSCSPHFSELAELYPHLEFEAICPEDKIDLMTSIVVMNNPALMARIRFRSDDAPLTPCARVYLMIGMLHRKSDKQIVDMLENIYYRMDDSSRLIIVDSILSDAGEAPLATKRLWYCRDITMRQLHNAGDRTLSELNKLAEQASNGDLTLKCHTRQPGATSATVVFRNKGIMETREA
ncbi:hypothetical protein HDV57DRAFT_513111 [Trichoderma longibrachiatum]